jgi:hypothetical protein
VFYKTFKNNAWSIPVGITGSGFDSGPTLTQLNNGTILFIWSNQTCGTCTPPGNNRLVYQRYNSGYWSGYGVLTQPGNADDTGPAAAVAPDGTLWVFWTRSSLTAPFTKQVFYKTLANNAVWSGDVQTTVDTNWNWMPSVAIGKDGAVRLAWSKGPNNPPLYQIYYKSFSQNSWTAENHIVSSSFSDTRPSIMLDRDGTVWTFWTRKTPGIVDTFDIYSKISSDAGITWSAETAMTSQPTGKYVTNEMPAGVQSTVGNSLWVFYTTNGAGTGEFDIYAVKSSAVSPIHDIAITGITASPPMTYPWGDAPSQSIVSVAVTNLGDFSESPVITVKASNGALTYNIGSLTFTGVAPLSSMTLSIFWNVTKSQASGGRYGFTASTPPVPGESLVNTGDNVLTGTNTQIVLLPGALAKTLCITIIDAGMMGRAFGSTPSSIYWNPDADLDRNGIITIIDFGILAANFGKCV